jgi:hypothetical protein
MTNNGRMVACGIQWLVILNYIINIIIEKPYVGTKSNNIKYFMGVL